MKFTFVWVTVGKNQAGSNRKIFWKEVYYSLAEFLNAHQKDLQPELKTSSLLWYSPQISKSILYLPQI